MEHLDLRWLTAGAMVFIGLFITVWAFRLYSMSEHRSADFLGPHLKESGLRILYTLLPATLILGVFLIAAGVSKGIYWARWQGEVASEAANTVGVMEALLSIAACGVLLVTVRACKQR